MIKCNYSADEWVRFTAFETNRGVSSTIPGLSVWQSWISQQTDVWQWYKEWFTQSVTWYFRMVCYIAGGLGWIELCDLGKGTHSSPEGTTFPLHFPHCLQHYVLLSPYTGLWQLHKKMRLTENSNRIRLSLNSCHTSSTNMKTQFIKCLTHRSYFQNFNLKILKDTLISLLFLLYKINCLVKLKAYVKKGWGFFNIKTPLFLSTINIFNDSSCTQRCIKRRIQLNVANLHPHLHVSFLVMAASDGCRCVFKCHLAENLTYSLVLYLREWWL